MTLTWPPLLVTSAHCESTSTAMPTWLRGAVDHGTGMRCFTSAMSLKKAYDIKTVPLCRSCGALDYSTRVNCETKITSFPVIAFFTGPTSTADCRA